MNGTLAALVAGLLGGSSASAVVSAWASRRRTSADVNKITAEADHVAVDAATSAVALVRAEMDRLSAELASVRADAHANAVICQREQDQLRTRLDLARAENSDLRARVEVLEHELKARMGDGR